MSIPNTVAFLGLGRMGRPIATNIAKAGFRVVVYNRTRRTAEEFAAANPGVIVADTPREAAAAADVVVTMLADEVALRAVYGGTDGLLAGWQPGKVALDMGTTGPDGTRWLSESVAAAGGTAIDSPVSGAVAAAEAAALTLLVGGPGETVDTLRPLLQSVGSAIYHLGGSGAGAIMKLSVNNVIYALGQAVSESLVLAERAGIDRADAYDVFCNSAIAAPMVKYRQDNYVNPDTATTQFAMTLAAKDLHLITDLAKEVGAPMPQAAVNLVTHADAIESGLGDQDMAAVAVYLRASAADES